MIRLSIAALALFPCLVMSSVSAQENSAKFQITYDENGNPILTPFDEVDDTRKRAVPSSPDSALTLAPKQKSDLIEGNKDAGFTTFQGYQLTGPEGETAVIAIPSGVAPARWVNPDYIYELKQANPDFLAAGLGRTAQQQAQEYLRLMAKAAYDEYCGSTVRPSEFTIEVSIGADFVVNGEAKVSAKFVSSEICKD